MTCQTKYVNHCKNRNKEGQRKITIISFYAPTLEVRKRNPKNKEEYYEDYENVIKTMNKRDTRKMGGDSNAKTGLDRKEFPEFVVKYGKDKQSSYLMICFDIYMIFATL